MRKDPTIGKVQDDGEVKRFGDLLQTAFMFPAGTVQPYLESAGLENARLIRYGTDLAGGLLLVPGGQWFWGKSVPTACVAAVAVAPEFRAYGAASELLNAAMHELHDRGIALSTLFPATLGLYRRAGYETGGVVCLASLPTGSIRVHEPSMKLRAAESGDEPAIREVYRRWARRITGNMDRVDFNWREMRTQGADTARGYVVCRDGEIEGYAHLVTRTDAPGRHTLSVTDLAAVSPEAERRLLTFFATHRTMHTHVEWRSSVSDTMWMHLREHNYPFRRTSPWMVRVVHVPNALSARGYPPGLQAEVHLEVRDDLLPENNGPFVLRVADGRGTVEPGGRGTLAIDVRGLAALFTGLLSPYDLVSAKLCTAPDSELVTASAVFAGPLPWMRDGF